MNRLLLLLALLLTYAAASGQASSRRAQALLVNDPPKIDGILDDPAWTNAPVATGFIQREPYNGRPASFETEVRFTYDQTGLYIGAMMTDPHPDSIPAQLGLRDASSLNADNFIVVISPFNDGLNAFCFMLTVSDVQSDFKLSLAGGEDASWDAVWTSKARKNDHGWVAEFKIPYSAIRFPKKEIQEWGLNCQREIRRYREISTWNLVDSKVEGYVNQSGVLDGIREVTPPVRLSVTPYVSGYLQNSPENKEYEFSYNYGADLKYGINESFTLDMTLIPDFGQVPSDDRVYNFSPFEIRYDERRQFFTEGTEMFNKGGIFYSRRVGSQPKGYDEPYADLQKDEIVTDNPSQTKLINATKISGRTTGGLGIGVFNGISANTWATVTDTLTGASRKVLTQGFTNYNTMVLDQNLKNNSYIDFLNTNYFMPTEGYTANVTGTSFKFANRKYTYGLTGDAFVSQKYHAHGAPEFGYHYSWTFSKLSGNFRFNVQQLLETDQYDPNDMGFNTVNNRVINNASVQYNIYEPFWKVLNWYNYAEVGYNSLYQDFSFVSLDFYAESNTTTRKHLTLGANTSFSPIPSHDYYEPRVAGWMYVSPAYWNMGTWLSSDYSKKLAIDFSLNGNLAPADKCSGWGFRLAPRYRVTDRFFLRYQLSYNKILNDIGYVDQSWDSAGNVTIFFGRRDRQTVINVLEGNYMLTSNMSIDLRVRHYWATALYLDYSRLLPDGNLTPASYQGDPDVDYNTFNLDLTYIWNFAPGSQISVVWKNSIATFDNDIEPGYLNDLSNTLSSPASNSISIRILYYLDALYFKKKDKGSGKGKGKD